MGLTVFCPTFFAYADKDMSQDFRMSLSSKQLLQIQTCMTVIRRVNLLSSSLQQFSPDVTWASAQYDEVPAYLVYSRLDLSECFSPLKIVFSPQDVNTPGPSSYKRLHV